MSFRSISSSKVSTTSLLLKLTVESGGSAFRSMGGKESLGPPAGGMILAQPVGTDVQNAATSMKMNAVKKQVFFIRDKLTCLITCLVDDMLTICKTIGVRKLASLLFFEPRRHEGTKGHEVRSKMIDEKIDEDYTKK